MDASVIIAFDRLPSSPGQSLLQNLFNTKDIIVDISYRKPPADGCERPCMLC